MQSALAKVDGVEDVKVNYDAKTVQVVCSEGKDVDEAALVAALEGAGFGGSVKK